MSQHPLEYYAAKIPVLSPSEHPSCEDILAKEAPDFSLKGKTILVTGASSGIGIPTVTAFASKGARVIVAVRDVEKTKKVLDTIAAAHPNHGGLDIVQMELESLESVKAGAQKVLSITSQLNVLVNNAGVMNYPFALTKDGHEYHFGVNHIGHFLLFKLLLPLLLKSSTPSFQSRVVSLSSVGHLYSDVDVTDLKWTKRQYNPPVAYGQSKTANLLFAREIENRYGKQGLHAWAVHPGGIQTELARHTTFDDLVGFGIFNKEGELLMPDIRYKSLTQGAATSVWAAISSELEGKGGLYLEDAHVAGPQKGFGGHATYAYDDENARKLWEYSEEAVSKFVQ